MARRYDAVVTIGTWVDTNTGEVRYKNRTIGAVVETPSGLALKLDATFNPAGMKRNDDGTVWVNLFVPREVV